MPHNLYSVAFRHRRWYGLDLFIDINETNKKNAADVHIQGIHRSFGAPGPGPIMI